MVTCRLLPKPPGSCLPLCAPGTGAAGRSRYMLGAGLWVCSWCAPSAPGELAAAPPCCLYIRGSRMGWQLVCASSRLKSWLPARTSSWEAGLPPHTEDVCNHVTAEIFSGYAVIITYFLTSLVFNYMPLFGLTRATGEK